MRLLSLFACLLGLLAVAFLALDRPTTARAAPRKPAPTIAQFPGPDAGVFPFPGQDAGGPFPFPGMDSGMPH